MTLVAFVCRFVLLDLFTYFNLVSTLNNNFLGNAGVRNKFTNVIKLVLTVKALEELPQRNNRDDMDDRSPDVELPIYQQRDNFFT